MSIKQNVFENLYKTMKESISSNVAELFYSKRTQKELKGYLGTHGTRALDHLRHLDTLTALGHSYTWALQTLLGTQTIRHLGTRRTLFSKHTWVLEKKLTIAAIWQEII